jgi:hypothetical protein
MIIGSGTSNIDVEVPRDAYDTGRDMPTFNAYLTVIVRDSEGRVIRIHKQRSHSPTANFIGLLLPISYFGNTNSSYTLTNTGGTNYSFTVGCTSNNIGNCSGISYPNTDYNFPSYVVMIQVGSGQQPNPYTAHSLAAPIANGSGAGQLIYGTITTPSNLIASGSSAYFYVSQAFNNQSGGTVTITEVGIITQFQITCGGCGGSTNYGQLLVWYDVLSSPISVPNGVSVVIYYTFTVNP